MNLMEMFKKKPATIDDVVAGFQKNIDDLNALQGKHALAAQTAREEAEATLAAARTAADDLLRRASEENTAASRARSISAKISKLIDA